MRFEEKVDIGYVRKLFKDLFYRLGYEYDFIFDWMVSRENPAKEIKLEDDQVDTGGNTTGGAADDAV